MSFIAARKNGRRVIFANLLEYNCPRITIGDALGSRNYGIQKPARASVYEGRDAFVVVRSISTSLSGATFPSSGTDKAYC